MLGFGKQGEGRHRSAGMEGIRRARGNTFARMALATTLTLLPLAENRVMAQAYGNKPQLSENAGKILRELEEGDGRGQTGKGSDQTHKPKTPQEILDELEGTHSPKQVRPAEKKPAKEERKKLGAASKLDSTKEDHDKKKDTGFPRNIGFSSIEDMVVGVVLATTMVVGIVWIVVGLFSAFPVISTVTAVIVLIHLIESCGKDKGGEKK